MRAKNKVLSVSFLINLVIILIPVAKASANNLSISNVSLEDRNSSSDTVVVQFDLSWDHSWRSKINHDAIWVTIRLSDSASSLNVKKLCQLTAAGLNPAGSSVGSSHNLEIYVPADKYGAMIRPASFSTIGSVSSTKVRLVINYASGGFSDADNIYASVFGIEMVYIPEGAFYAGDYDASTASLDQGSGDADPWSISSEGEISVANPASDGFRYVSNSNAGEDATGTSFTIPAGFPKGYKAFYCMKYEITEGQWVEFVNSLPESARSNVDLTDGVHKNSDAVKYRNTISCSGSPLTCSTTRPDRAVSFLSWMNLSSFLDWVGLRPMTELEYEKISRGPGLPLSGAYAWGSTSITAAVAILGVSEEGSETISTAGANANYNNTVLSGGDTGLGSDYQKGPLRVGILATDSSTRETSGSGYYGVMDLSGDLAERVITIGNAAGRAFTGNHGNGLLTTASGYEGFADVSGWVGMDANPDRGVTGASGSGFKGGSWEDASSQLRVSDRSNAALALTDAQKTYGGRGVRTDE